MDSITHLTQKILVERARQGIQQPTQIPSTEPPPPYTASGDDNDSDSDSEPDDEDTDDSPLRLTINAASSIQGSNNLVPISPSPLADATKFSALLLHAVDRINNASTATATRPSKRRVNVELTINCGVTIVGDRNVVGNVGLRPRAPEKAIAGPGAVAAEERLAATVGGAKRKARETPDGEPRQKRPTVSSTWE